MVSVALHLLEVTVIFFNCLFFFFYYLFNGELQKDSKDDILSHVNHTHHEVNTGLKFAVLARSALASMLTP